MHPSTKIRPVLICDDELDHLGYVIAGLYRNDIPVIGVRYIDEASEILFSPDPPGVFIADYKAKKLPTREAYEKWENERDTSQMSDLIKEVQKRVPDIRNILISAIEIDIPTRNLNVFAYAYKGSEYLDNLIHVCRLGALQKNEVDISGKLREGPVDLSSDQAVRQYIEQRFPVRREREV